MKAYSDEAQFVEVLENILGVAVNWGFNTNYAYKKGIRDAKGSSIEVHQDHFHLGYKKK